MEVLSDSATNAGYLPFLRTQSVDVGGHRIPSAARLSQRHEAMTTDPRRQIRQSTTLVIPGDPPSLNAALSGRLRQRIRDKQEWQGWTHNAWLAAGQPTFQRPEVWVRCYFRTERRRDAENYSLKPLIDQLTRSGCWPDDNHEVYLQHRAELYVDPAYPRVEIEIAEQREEQAA